MEAIIIFNEWMAEKVRKFCAWFEIKTGLGYNFIARFLNFGFVSIALTMLCKTKYYNTYYVTIEMWFNDFILKSIFFILILFSFLLIFLSRSKEGLKELDKKRAIRSPIFYQIKKVITPILLLFFIIFPTLPLLIKGHYLDILIIINWGMIVIFQDYYCHQTVHDS